MKTRSLLGIVMAGCMCAGAAPLAKAQCASYLVAPGAAVFIPGTTDIGLYQDDATTSIALPFSFSLYGNAFTSVNVAPNGYLDFTTAHAFGYYSNGCLPYVDSGLGPVIMPYWDDLRTDQPTGAGLGVFTGVIGTAPNRTFVIEWRAVHYDIADCGNANFEVLLYEGTSSFDVVYGDTGICAGSSATAGVQDAGGTGGYTQYSCSTGGGTSSLTNGLSLHFSCVAFTEGACCNGAGGCTPTEPAACTGSFLGIGVACSPTNPCGGACCDISTSCTVSTASGCPAGNVFLNGALCSPSPCPLGVCCSNLGGACTLSTSTTCASGSTFTSGIMCSPSPCVAIGTCCTNSGGACTPYFGGSCPTSSSDGGSTSCSPSPCVAIGICCDTITSQCTVLYGGFCSVNASYDSSTFSCTPPPCPQVAWGCCLGDGSCIMLFQNDCGTRGGAWQPGTACGGTFVCSGSTNLLQNPGAETGDMSGWTLTANVGGGEHAGDFVGWSASNDDLIHSGANSFSTSYILDERNQVIDLLAAGYTAAQLDAAPPIAAGEWVATRFDSGASYYLGVELLAADQTTVIASYEDGSATALIQLPVSTPYFQDASTLTNYGPGVRYVRFKDGGVSTNFWAGHYGAHFDDAFVSVLLSSPCCASGGACSVMSNADCITAGGTPAAPGTTCAANPCSGGSTGVCCRGATCNTGVSQANCTTASVRAGSHFASGGSSCNSGTVSHTPCCYADYNKINGVTVQDIFDFLADWFAGSTYAKVGSNGATTGLSVQNIFDFLSNWFAGGC